MYSSLHPSTQKVLDYLEEQRRRNRTPTMQEVADNLGLNRLDVINRVLHLRRIGFLKWQQRSEPSKHPGPEKKIEKVELEPVRDYTVFDKRKTPLSAVRDLLELENFEGKIWDPARGRGDMSALLKAKFGKRFRATDILSGDDFLASTQRVDTIITHPPLRLSKEFAVKALELANKKVALWLGLNFLEDARQLGELGKALKAVHIPKVKEPRRSILASAPLIELPRMAWFVWDKDHDGAARVNWM